MEEGEEEEEEEGGGEEGGGEEIPTTETTTGEILSRMQRVVRTLGMEALDLREEEEEGEGVLVMPRGGWVEVATQLASRSRSRGGEFLSVLPFLLPTAQEEFFGSEVPGEFVAASSLFFSFFFFFFL